MNNIQISTGLLTDNNVNSTEVRIYCFLRTLDNSNNLSELTNLKLSQDMDISLKTVTRALAVLEGEGYITRVQDKNIRRIYFTDK